MTLQQLRYFLAACEYGSFTAAADSLFIAQPSLAEQVRRLEQELGVRLFVRTGRRLSLTESGTNLQTHAKRVMAAMAAAEASVNGTRDLQRGTASLGTFGVAYRYMVKEVVSTFVARHPHVSVRVIGQHSFEVVDKIRRGELEAGLISLPVDEVGLVVEPIMSDQILYAALPGPDTAQPMAIERLAQTRFIVYEAVSGWKDSIRSQLKQQAVAAGTSLEAAIEVEHVESALELAARGLGGTYVLERVAEDMGTPGALELVPFDPPMYDTFAFVWRRDHEPSPATKELIRLARAHMLSFGRPVLPPSESTGPVRGVSESVDVVR
jgi:DNA-binding transcriptional LysR family regulator